MEVAKNILCNGRRSYSAVGDDVFVLGGDEAHLIQQNYYGNVKPEDLASLVKREIRKLPKGAPVKFVAPLNQVWCIGRGGVVMVFDTVLKSWFKRQFNSEVLDVFSAGDDVFIVKPDRISKLDKNSSKDNGEYLPWRFFTQRLVSHHDFLLKQSKVSVTPLNGEHYCGYFVCGQVKLPIPLPNNAIKVFGNDSPIYNNKTRIMREDRRKSTILPQLPDERIFDSEQMIFGNQRKIFSPSTYVIESRNVFRSKYLDVSGHGEGGSFELHSIVLDAAEV